MADLCNRFLTARLRKMEAGELSPRSFAEYRQATDLLISTFGKLRLVDDLAADDFESLRAYMAKRWGPARLSKFIQLVRTTFKHAVDNALVDRPVMFGSGFNKPGKAVMRRHKAASSKKLFGAGEIRMIDVGAAVLMKHAAQDANYCIWHPLGREPTCLSRASGGHPNRQPLLRS